MNKLNISIIFITLALSSLFVLKGNSQMDVPQTQEDVKRYREWDRKNEENVAEDKRIYRPVTEEEVTHLEPNVKSNHLFLKELSMVVIKLDSLQNEQTKILKARIDSLEAKLKRAHITYREVEGDPSNYRVLVEISFEPEDSLEGK